MKKNINKKIKILRPTRKKHGQSSWFDAFLSISPIFHLLFITILAVILLFLLSYFNNSVDNSYEGVKQKRTDVKKVLRHDVFGDHYVNDLLINSKLSNFYYDKIVTAFTFAPDYSWQQSGSCSDKYCGLDSEKWNFAGEKNKKYCLKNKCLLLNDLKLFFNNQELKNPLEVSGELKSVNIYPLSQTWLVGFVFLDGEIEKGFVYNFDGHSFKNLYPREDDLFVSRSGFEGASFGFGGDDNNFLVMYGGYDFIAYQNTENKKIDVSRFFGLRVSDGGFSPIALKLDENGETVWYICSLQEKKPRFVKLWQNSSDSIKGSLSFSEIIFDKNEKADSAWCRLNSDNDLEFLISGNNNYYYKKTFTDRGFIQENYFLTSKDISGGRNINSVIFNNLLACDDQSCGADVFKNSLNFKVSGDSKNFFDADLNREINFSDKSKGLYYSITTKNKNNNNKNYSPWIDGLTSISYSFWD